MKRLIQLTLGLGLMMSTASDAQFLSPQWAEIGVQSEAFVHRESAVNSAGELYTIAEFYDVVYVEEADMLVPLAGLENSDFILQKRDANGTLLWSKVYGGTGNDFVTAMDISDAGDIYLAGTFSGTINFGSLDAPYEVVSQGGQDAFILKLDQDAVLQWVDVIGTAEQEWVTALSVDKDDYLAVAGVISGPTDMDAGESDYILSGNQGLYVKKLSQDGAFVWAKEMGSTEDMGEDYIEHIVLDEGNIYFAGTIAANADMAPGGDTFVINTNDNGMNTFVEKLDADGNLVFVNEIDGIGVDHIANMDLSSDGNVWLLGSFYGSFDADPGAGEYLLSTSEVSDDISDDYLIKYGSDGALIHAGVFEASGATVLKHFAIDEFEKIYLTGAINGQIDLSPGVEEELYSNTTNETFILKLDADSQFESLDVMDSEGSIWDTNIIAQPEGQLFFTGSFHASTDFDPGTSSMLLAPTLSTIESPIASFHAKYNGVYVGLEEEIADQGFVIYPNPSSGELNVSFGTVQQEIQLKILDITGRVIQENSYKQTDKIRTEIIGAASVYFVELSTDSGLKKFQKILKYQN